MPIPPEQYQSHIIVFVLVLTRVSGLVMTAPIFGARSVPMHVRVILAMAIAALVTPLSGAPQLPNIDNVIELSLLIAREAILGLSLGLAVLLLVFGVQLAGNMMAQMSGMQMSDVVDPSVDTRVSVFAQLLNMVSLAVFVSIGGHRMVMEALLDTFQSMPVGDTTVSLHLFETLSQIMTMSFQLAIRASAPVIASLLMSVLVLGLISRTLPQLNILAVGFSLNALILLLTLSVSLGTTAWLFQQHAHEVVDLLRVSLQAVAPHP